jgi:hypothetical protein
MKTNKPISETRAEEQLRQERDAFEQHKRRAERWFVVRQLIVGASGFILLAILVMALLVLFNPERYHPMLVAAAGTAVFGEILYAMLFVWKTTVSPEWNEPVQPITVGKTSVHEGQKTDL